MLQAFQRCEETSPGILQSPAARPWRPTLQSTSSKLLLTTPGVSQDKQQARRWPIGVWLDLLLLSLSEGPKIGQAPGALATTQSHLRYYHKPSHTLAAAVWA
eukprot:1159276-Pelagomonas_calceolata.AAC.8